METPQPEGSPPFKKQDSETGGGGGGGDNNQNQQNQNFQHQRRDRGGFNRRGGNNQNFNPRFRNHDPNFRRRPFNRDQNDDGGADEPYDRDMRFQFQLNDKLAAIAGPSLDLPLLDTAEKKFSGRNRLYIGNLGPEVTQDDLNEELVKYGEIIELFVNKEKNFGFVKFDYYANAEKAKRELDGLAFKNKNLKVRFAPNNATVKVKNLSNFVSNELLYHAFQVFGEIERALVVVDERGKPTGEGIVEFVRKGCALNAVKKCNERCFFITESLRPCLVEPYEFVNDTDGYSEKFLPKRNPEYLKSRSKGPRLAELKSFEHEYGVRWKQLLELYAQKEESLKAELRMETDKLEAQMEYARYEHETDMLREELRAREQDRDRQKQEWEMKERHVEEQRRRNEELIRRQEESIQAQISQQDDDMRRRQQENTLFMQAHQLHSMLEEQEQTLGGFSKGESFDLDKRESFEGSNSRDGFGGPNSDHDNPPPLMSRGGGGGGRGFGRGRGRWMGENRRDNFGPKRRRL